MCYYAQYDGLPDWAKENEPFWNSLVNGKDYYTHHKQISSVAVFQI